MKRSLVLSMLALPCMATVAHADPIFTPIFTTILTSVSIPASVTVASTTISIAAVLSSITVTALGVGLSFLLAPKPPKPGPEAGQIPTQQPIPYRQFGYGYVRVAGAFMLKENLNGWLVYVLAVLGHKCAAFEGAYLNDDPVTLFDYAGYGAYFDGDFTGTVFPGSDNRYANGIIQIDTRLGANTEDPYRFITSFLGISTTWSTDHRGDKITSAMVASVQVPKENFGQFYPYGAPIPSFVLKSALCFDPRETDQTYDDDSTWQFRDNAALAIMHFLCFSDYGYQLDYTVAIEPVIDDWIEQIDYCDEQVAEKGGGTERRYRLGGWMTTEQDRKTALETMLAACDGWLCQRGDGTVILRVGRYVAPTITLTDDDICGWKLDTDLSSNEKVNRATAKWTYPDAGYASVETDPFENTADQALRQGPIRTAQLDLTWVQSVGQASRLTKIELNKHSKSVRGTLQLRLQGMNACYERWVAIQSNTIPRLSNAVIEIRKPVISLIEGKCSVEFVLSGSDVYDYTAATDESETPYIPERPSGSTLSAPANVTGTAEQYENANGGFDVIIDVNWDVPQLNGGDRTDLSYIVRWRVAPASGDDPPWTQLTVTNPTTVASVAYASLGVVPKDETIQVQVAAVAANGYQSDWSATEEIDTSVSTTAPGSPTNLIASTSVTGAVDLSVTAPNSANFSAIQFYRSAVSDPFGSAVAIGSPVFGSANSTIVYTDTVSAGSYDYWATSLNAYSVESTPVGPTTGTSV